MKRFACLVVLLLAGAALVAPTAGAADYTAYVGCSADREAVPATSCPYGSSPGAFFRSPEATVTYDVCVGFPDGRRRCSGESEAEQGTLYVNAILAPLAGLHTVEWLVGEVVVASTKFEILSAPPSAPVAPAPEGSSAPVVVTPKSVTLSPACIRERQRVKRLLAKLAQAQGKEAKAKVRPRLRAARVAVKRLCAAT